MSSLRSALEIANNRLCIAFVNTVATHDGASPYDLLCDCDALLEFMEQAGVIDASRAAAYRKHARTDPRIARRVLTDAHRLRRVLFAMLSAVIERTAIEAAVLSEFNAMLGDAQDGVKLASGDDGYAYAWPPPTDDPRTMLLPVVRSACAVLTSEECNRLSVCAGRACTWVFIDATKNHSRRYCSSSTCGNRTRVHRFYEARRSTRA